MKLPTPAGEQDPKIFAALKKFDHDNDGKIDASEMASLTKYLMELEARPKNPHVVTFDINCAYDSVFRALQCMVV